MIKAAGTFNLVKILWQRKDHSKEWGHKKGLQNYAYTDLKIKAKPFRDTFSVVP